MYQIEFPLLLLIEPSCFELRRNLIACLLESKSQQVTNFIACFSYETTWQFLDSSTHTQHIRLNWNSICLDIIETLALSGVNFLAFIPFPSLLPCPCHQWHFDCTTNNTHTTLRATIQFSVIAAAVFYVGRISERKGRAVCNLWGWAQNVCSQYLPVAEFSISNSSENQNANTCEHHKSVHLKSIQNLIFERFFSSFCVN